MYACAAGIGSKSMSGCSILKLLIFLFLGVAQLRGRWVIDRGQSLGTAPGNLQALRSQFVRLAGRLRNLAVEAICKRCDRGYVAARRLLKWRSGDAAERFVIVTALNFTEASSPFVLALERHFA
jgi:hypothetical protein